MLKKFICLGFIAGMFFAAGCETAKGMKTDLTNTWHNSKTWDEWCKENLW